MTKSAIKYSSVDTHLEFSDGVVRSRKGGRNQLGPLKIRPCEIANLLRTCYRL